MRAAFTDPQEFWSSPLYRHLCRVVVQEPFLLGLAAHTRAGQVPTFAFLGAIHWLLLGGAEHPLAEFYPSLVGQNARPPQDAGPELLSFARLHEAQLVDIVSTRLVQTNHVRRAVGLRLALASVAASIGDAPVHLLEIGSSAGLLMRQSHYGYHLGRRRFGARSSPVQLVSEWRSEQPVPDLDAVPVMNTTCGIDLHPIDPANEADRRWLEALIWPEDRDKAAQLRQALSLAATVPVQVLAGDAADLCPVWSATIPRGEARVVFHCATRMHVPTHQLERFDQAIETIAEDGPLYHVAIEGEGIQVAEPDQPAGRRYDGDGHLAWVTPATNPG